MQTISVNRDDYKRLVRCYKQHTRDGQWPEWDAVFSCNQNNKAWPAHDKGRSHCDDRENVYRRFSLLREIVKIVLADRPIGGRFFLKKDGVFVKPEGEDIRQIISFNW